jgi:hypothetical protein
VIFIKILEFFLGGLVIEAFSNWFGELGEILIVFKDLIASFDLSIGALALNVLIDEVILSR